MFHEHHHRNIFPLIIVALTLALLLVLVLLFWPAVYNQSIGVSVGADRNTYERDVVRVMTKCEERVALSEFDDARYDVVSTAMSDTLALVVPSEYQDMHLKLVIALDMLRQGYSQSDAEKIKKGEEMVSSLKSQYPWL